MEKFREGSACFHNLTIILDGTGAISVIEFPEYLKRMRKGTNKKTHLANEYEVTFSFLSCNILKEHNIIIIGASRSVSVRE